MNELQELLKRAYVDEESDAYQKLIDILDHLEKGWPSVVSAAIEGETHG